jgi:hypothetical protein
VLTSQWLFCLIVPPQINLNIIMLNRAAILLKLKQAAVDWINAADPMENPGYSLKSANEDRTVYLVSDEVAEDPVSLTHWLRLNWEVLFEAELEAWYVDKSLWVQERSFEMFQEWFEVECHSMITDTGDTPIEDDGY